MKNRLSHPIWTHIPAIAMLIFLIVYTIMAGTLPSRAAIHFDFHGVPNDFGSPYLVVGLVFGLSLLFIVISAIIDEVHARYEKKKSFNWFSFLDELSIGFLGGVYIGYIDYLKYDSSSFNFPWLVLSITTGGLIILGGIVESLRPFCFNPNKIAFSNTAALEKELEQRIKNTASFIYWESQNPFWVSLISVILPLIMLISAGFAWFGSSWTSLIMVVVAILLVIQKGGLRTSVTQQEITVRFGLPGFKVLLLKTADISNIELVEFSPPRDFGGYGIRRNREMSAYYLRGSRGVKLTTTKGKKYLIGSDHPEELYAVTQAVVKSQGG